MKTKIYKLSHTLDAPAIYAVPDHATFVAEILADLKTLNPDARIPRFQMADPDADQNGFYYLSDSVLVFTKEVYLGELGNALDLAGNTYKSEITDTGTEVYLLNVTAFYNAIDRSRTIYYNLQGDEAIGVDHGVGIKSPAFFVNLIGDSRLFRLPQMPNAIFVATDGDGGVDDFYTSYKQLGMKGLSFELVWEEG